MTNLTRRSLLRAIPVAGATAMLSSAAVAAVATPAFAFADPEAENPQLIALGEAVYAAEAEYVAASAAVARILSNWSKHWPAAPEELISYGGEDVERDMTGTGIERLGENRSRRVATAKEIARHVGEIRQCISRKRNRDTLVRWWGIRLTIAEWEMDLGERYAVLAIAEHYEAEKAKVLNASGYPAARARRAAAEAALQQAVEKVMAHRVDYVAGLLVQARALSALGKLSPLARLSAASGAWDWPSQLATSLLRVMGDAA